MGGGGVLGSTDEFKAEMKMMFTQLSVVFGELWKEVIAIKKGKQKEPQEELGGGATTATLKGSEGSDAVVEDDLEVLVNLGNDLFLEDNGIPKPTFMKPQVRGLGKLSGPAADVVNMTYPAAWSSYLTPASDKTGSSTTRVMLGRTKSPIQAIPTFASGAGDNVHLWISKVKLWGAQSGWNQWTLIAQACMALKGTAATWLHTTGEEVMFKFNCFETELIKSFMLLSCVDLLNKFFICSQEQTEAVHNFYYQLLMLSKHRGLANPDLFTMQFQEGLHTNVCWSIELLPSWMLLEKIYEWAKEIKAHLGASPTQQPLVSVVEEETPPHAMDKLQMEMCKFKESICNVVAWVQDSQAGPHWHMPMSEIQCFHCHKNGHFTWDCTEPLPSGRQHLNNSAGLSSTAERTSN